MVLSIADNIEIKITFSLPLALGASPLAHKLLERLLFSEIDLFCYSF